jgi:hypothetical protein
VLMPHSLQCHQWGIHGSIQVPYPSACLKLSVVFHQRYIVFFGKINIKWTLSVTIENERN